MARRSIFQIDQIIELRDNDESRYFAITEFNNCLSFDHRSFDQLNMSNNSLPPIHHNHTRAEFRLRMSRILLAAKTLICRQLFAGHVVSSRLMKKKEKIHRIIICVRTQKI